MTLNKNAKLKLKKFFPKFLGYITINGVLISPIMAKSMNYSPFYLQNLAYRNRPQTTQRSPYVSPVSNQPEYKIFTFKNPPKPVSQLSPYYSLLKDNISEIETSNKQPRYVKPISSRGYERRSEEELKTILSGSIRQELNRELINKTASGQYDKDVVKTSILNPDGILASNLKILDIFNLETKTDTKTNKIISQRLFNKDNILLKDFDINSILSVEIIYDINNANSKNPTASVNTAKIVTPSNSVVYILTDNKK